MSVIALAGLIDRCHPICLGGHTTSRLAVVMLWGGVCCSHTRLSVGHAPRVAMMLAGEYPMLTMLHTTLLLG